MTFGMNVYKPSGGLVYSTDDVTWNQVDFFYMSANSSVANSYAALSGREALVIQMFIDPPPTDRKMTAYTITVSGSTVNVSGGSENVYILVLMR